MSFEKLNKAYIEATLNFHKEAVKHLNEAELKLLEESKSFSVIAHGDPVKYLIDLETMGENNIDITTWYKPNMSVFGTYKFNEDEIN